MIDYLQGAIAYTGPGFAVVDVSGVGYMLSMSSKSIAALPTQGETTRVYCWMSVSEAGIALYGFGDVAEREMFQKLTSVKGIGPKAALGVLSALTPAELVDAIYAEDDRRISAAQGIGKKSAQRIILELKGSLDDQPSLAGIFAGGGAPDASEALVALLGMGFTEDEAKLAIDGFEGDPANTQEAIRYALKKLGGF